MAEMINALSIMLANPPDPNERIPLANHKSTMFGVSIPFHVLSWIFVGFRLHTRLRVVRQPGMDDAFVVLAALFNLGSLIAFLGGTRYALGHHLIYSLNQVVPTMHWLYFTNATYHTTTTCIKISLLLQFLRMYRSGLRRRICIGLLGIIILWGLAFMFMAWVPCFPVSGFWNRTMVPTPKCYGFGYNTAVEARTAVLSFSITNMVFDMCIFSIPLSEYFRKDLARKQIIAMTGLFSLGMIAVLMAVLRLWSTFKYVHDLIHGWDFTFWYPQVLIISCLEIDFAIMTASMPIFWPTVVASWGQIFVTNEVRVTHHQRLEDNSRDHFEMGRTNSLKSTTSTQGLTRSGSVDQKPYYIDNMDPTKKLNSGFSQVEVQSQPHKKLDL